MYMSIGVKLTMGAVELLVSAVGFAGKVFEAIIPRNDKVEHSHKIEAQHSHTVIVESRGDPKEDVAVSEKEIHYQPITIVEERAFDEEFLSDIVDTTIDKLSVLLNEQTTQIFYVLQQQHIREAIQELQARVSALKTLLNYKEVDSSIATQILMSALNPLQVSLNIAEYRIKDANQIEVWEYCYIVGNSALLAGYAYLGQDLPRLREELTKRINEIQTQLLNQIATDILLNGGEIPWAEVPSMLKPENAYKLLDLTNKHKNTMLNQINLYSMTIQQIRIAIREIKVRNVLQQLYTEEQAGKNRVGALEAISTQMNYAS